MNQSIYADTALSPLVAISPHYDDAVFSCGSLLSTLPISTVITVYTGRPDNANLLTDWDQRCGFTTAGAAMQARTLENNTALKILNARHIDLGFLDSQYRQTPGINSELLVDTLSSEVSRLQPATVIFPLGLFHEDHIQVSDALLKRVRHLPAVRWLVYEDIPYCKQRKRVLERIKQLERQGVFVSSFAPEGLKSGKNGSEKSDTECMKGSAKERAVAAYKSQFRGLGHHDAHPIMRHPEKYWRLHTATDLA